MTLFNYINLQIIKSRDNDIVVKNNKLQQQKRELEETYDYTVTFVLLPNTAYTDFKNYIEENFVVVDEIHVSNRSDYVILFFSIKAHNNDEMALFFQEMKEKAPRLSNAEYHVVP